ncbi:MAG: apolipoprotein N-acyltransferase [Deltaproteobacteria bacterium]|nr:apolipoprotein N-acyltransferase [Deltaproteobacteria bacterium]
MQRFLATIAKLPLRRLPWRFIGTGFLSASLLVLSFPPASIWPLAFIGFVPFLLGLLYARNFREVAWMGATHSIFYILFGFSFVSFVVTNFGGLPWIVGKLVLVIFSLFVALPVVYIGLDFTYPKIFPNTLGHVLYNWLPVAQLAEITGLFGLTVPILLSNLAIAILLSRTVGRRQLKGPAAAGLAGPFSAVLALALVAGFLWNADRWGRARMEKLNAQERGWTRKLKISVIQGNIGDIDKLSSERGYEPAIAHVLNTYREATLDSVKNFHPDLVIWPETSYPFLYTHLMDQGANASGAARDQWMKDFVHEINTPMFFGSYSNSGKRDFNTAFLVKPPFDLAGQYRKSILLAFGEYIPLGPFSSIIQDIVPSIADFGRGPGPVLFDVKGAKLGPQICYEGIFPEHSRGAVKLGADFLLNITNDSWFGLTGEPKLHLLLTIFRSIETRRPMIRATNTGISTVVDLTGEMRWSTRLFEPASIDTTLNFPGPGQHAPVTFYTRHGEYFASTCGVFTLLASLLVFGPGVLGWSRRRATSVKALIGR